MRHCRQTPIDANDFGPWTQPGPANERLKMRPAPEWPLPRSQLLIGGSWLIKRRAVGGWDVDTRRNSTGANSDIRHNEIATFRSRHLTTASGCLYNSGRFNTRFRIDVGCSPFNRFHPDRISATTEISFSLSNYGLVTRGNLFVC